MSKILVLGVGNLLLKDEGVGVHLAQRMMKMDLPENVEVVDGGTATLDILPLVDGVDRLIIVDALKGGETPGTIYKLTPEDIVQDNQEPLSLHQIDLLQMLDMCALIGSKPSTVIIGIEPKEVDFAVELSPEVEGMIPRVIELVLKEVTNSPAAFLANA